MSVKEFVSNYIVEILAFLAIFFSDLSAALLAVGFLVFADTFTGVWVAKRKEGWKGVTSRKAGRIITKIILYPLAIIVAKVSQAYLTPAIPWIDVTTGIIATIEIKSIFENISSILGYSLWSRIRTTLWKDKHTDVDQEVKEKKNVRRNNKQG